MCLTAAHWNPGGGYEEDRAYSQWCIVGRQEAVGINWNKRCSAWLKGKPLSQKDSPVVKQVAQRGVQFPSLKVSMMQLDKALNNLV